MKNLLKETLDILASNGKTPDDVIWCGSNISWFTWDEFKIVSDTSYDSGYGGQEVAENLLIVGKDFWLERHEYDGAEWWEFKSMPKKPRIRLKLSALTSSQAENYKTWATLEELNTTEIN